MLAIAIDDIGLLLKVADIAAAMSVESLLGTDRPYDERVQVIRPHPGQLASAGNLRRLLAGSPLIASHRESDHAVQDSYCLRCAPQVHGAVRDVYAHARRVLDIELGSIVDNPVIVPDGEVMSTGNFHGEPLAFAGDMLAIAISELASISERRTDRMLDPAFSRDLPAVPRQGPGHQLRPDDRAVHRGVPGQREQGSRAPLQRRHDPHLGQPGGPRVDGLDLDAQAARDRARTSAPCCRSRSSRRRRPWTSGPQLASPGAASAAVHDRLRRDVPTMDEDRHVSDQLVAVDAMLRELVGAAEAAVGVLD